MSYKGGVISDGNSKCAVHGDQPEEIDNAMRLVRNNTIVSTISFLLPGPDSTSICPKHTIDKLATFLKVNKNIKNFECRTQVGDGFFRASRVSLCEALANGLAGDNLKFLDIRPSNLLNSDEAEFLERYLRLNRNLKQLAIGLEESKEALQLISALAESTVTKFKLYISSSGWMPEVGTRLGRCSSVVSLEICLLGSFDEDNFFAPRHVGVASFFNGIASLRGLKQLGIDLGSVKITSSVTEAIGSLVVQNGALEYFAVCSMYDDGDAWLHEVVEMVKASNSLVNVVINIEGRTQISIEDALTRLSIQETLNSFCILNRMFRTNLVGFGATAMWARRLSKIRDCSARATFLFRCLCEKPELIIGLMESGSNSTKRQRRF